ncbi:MAG: hypothetical protein QHI38_02985 [Armatimonadota bacterium]|nr:hypothetical protein [Armatimonadota bacterium]
MHCVISVMLLLTAPGGLVLPQAPCPGWTAGPQKTVLPSGIFDYMDGAGELYLGYGFRKLYVREYRKSGQPTIVCELYELPTAADAFGLFSYDRTGEPLKIGQGAVYASGLLLAWHGKYFLRILADRETPESKQCALELAKQTIKLCGAPGKPPAALQWLPKDNLDAETVHYFHTHMCLNYFHFLATKNILNLSGKTEAVMGTYNGKQGKSLALVVGYPSVDEARRAWEQFRKVYLAGLSLSGPHCLAKLENGRWVAGSQVGRKLVLVLESPTREDCLKLIEQILVCNGAKGGKRR